MRRQHRVPLVFGGLLLVVGALALAGCGGSSAAAQPTATPSAQSILQKVNSGNYKDGKFNITITGITGGTGTGTPSATPSATPSGTSFTGNGTGEFTTSPGRASITMTATISGQQVEIDVITDDASNTTYTRIPLLSSSWTKADSSSGGIGTGAIGDFSLKNATLVGTEQINGVSTYHLQGTDSTDAGTTDDLWVRTDNYQPVRVTTKSTDSSATIDFTSFNTGLTIDLPPADQVQG